LHTHASVVKVT